MSQDKQPGNAQGEFEDYIEGKSGLSKLYAGLPEVAPPDHLDAAILAEAHRAVGARPTHTDTGGRARRRWAMPLSVAASLIVAVMIGLQLPHLLKEPAVQQAARQDRAAGVAQEKNAPAPEKKQAEAAPPPPRVQANGVQANGVQANGAQANARPNAPEAREAAKPAPDAGGAQLNLLPPPAVAPAPAGAAEQPMNDSASVEAERARASERNSAARMGGDARMHLEAPAPAAPPAATMAAPAATMAVPAATMAAPAEPKEAAPARPAEAAKSKQAGAPALALSPEEWVARIRQLRQQGRLDEATQELAAFRKRYPDYPVPGDIAR